MLGVPDKTDKTPIANDAEGRLTITTVRGKPVMSAKDEAWLRRQLEELGK